MIFDCVCYAIQTKEITNILKLVICFLLIEIHPNQTYVRQKHQTNLRSIYFSLIAPSAAYMHQ